MSRANYEICPGCDGKALYVGEDDVPAGVVVWHQACLDQRGAELADLARDLDSAAAGIFDGTLGASRSWLLECANGRTHLDVVAASLRAAARIAREKAASGD